MHRIYILLAGSRNGSGEGLCRMLSGLFPHVNLTCNVYAVTPDLPGAMADVQHVQQAISDGLRKNLFLRCYFHLVHPAPEASLEDMIYCYKHLKRASREFDEEGYRHQELPRLMLLPILIPGAQDDEAILAGFLDTLKGLFMMPSLYLSEPTFFLSQCGSLLAKAEKVYMGQGPFGDMRRVIVGLCRQAIFDEACEKLAAGVAFADTACSESLIVAPQDGAVYPCMNSFLKKESLANDPGAGDAREAIAEFGAHMRGKQGCLACREKTMQSFSDLPLRLESRHEAGALLCHLGMFRQDAQDHVRAVEDFEQSLKLSPAEESGSLYFRLGLSLTRMGDFDRALEAFEKAAGDYGHRDYYHFHVGVCHFEKGDFRSALGAFRSSERLNPRPEDMLGILIYLGTCHNHLGEYEKARVPLEKAKAMAPHVPEVFHALGFSCFQLKQHDEAIQNLRRAVEIDPTSALGYASLGAAYREKGDVGTAIAMFQKALSLDPTIASARDNLERLKGLQ